MIKYYTKCTYLLSIPSSFLTMFKYKNLKNLKKLLLVKRAADIILTYMYVNVYKNRRYISERRGVAKKRLVEHVPCSHSALARELRYRAMIENLMFAWLKESLAMTPEKAVLMGADSILNFLNKLHDKG